MSSMLHALILGIVEGITEFLPISSTGHLILAGQLLGIADNAFQKSFDIIIQLGAILAVVALYWRSFLDMEISKRIAVAFVPTGIIGLAFYKIVKTYLLGNVSVVLWALAIGGLALILLELWHHEKDDAIEDIRNLSYGKAATIGCFQALSIIPGTSRSAATIVGGLLLGMRRTAIVEFSFLLAVPTMVAASGLDIIKNASAFSGADFTALAVGFIISFIVALASIKWLLGYVRSHTFTLFGIYRIVVAAAFFLFVVR